MSGALIQAEIAAALRGIGSEVGAGSFAVTIKRNTYGSGPEWDQDQWLYDTWELAAIESNIRERDTAGTLTGEITKTITVEAGIVVPAKGDKIIVKGLEYSIGSVMAISPAGVDLLYKITLER